MQIRRTLVAAAAGAAIVAGFAIAPSAQAAGRLCYDIDVNVNGDQVVDEAACQAIEAPPLPALP